MPPWSRDLCIYSGCDDAVRTIEVFVGLVQQTCSDLEPTHPLADCLLVATDCAAERQETTDVGIAVVDFRTINHVKEIPIGIKAQYLQNRIYADGRGKFLPQDKYSPFSQFAKPQLLYESQIEEYFKCVYTSCTAVPPAVLGSPVPVHRAPRTVSALPLALPDRPTPSTAHCRLRHLLSGFQNERHPWASGQRILPH